MNSFLRVFVPLAILMVIVAFVAYVTQNTTRPPERPPIIPVNPGEPVSGDPISFPRSLDEETAVKKESEVEFLGRSHKDFWFHTEQTTDVRMALNSKSCTCTDVHIGYFNFTLDEWEEWLKYPGLGGLCRLVGGVSFKPLLNFADNNFLTIPGTPEGRTPLPHLVRMKWQAKKQPQEGEGTEVLTIQLVAQIGTSGPYARYDHKISYRVVPAVGINPYSLDVGEISPNGNRSQSLYIWSFTRPKLDFAVKLNGSGGSTTEEPCFESSIKELDPTELKQLPQTLGSDFEQMRVPLVAYRITGTLHERRGEQQLELGPLKRKMIITFRTGDEATPISPLDPSLAAFIRGEVNVLNGDDNGRVTAGNFRYDRGRTVHIRLGADQPNLDLAVEQTSHELIKATLKNPETVEGRKEWDLIVEIAPNYILGELSPKTVVTLITKGTPPRRLRIPIIGKAER